MLKNKDRNSWESAQRVKIITAVKLKKLLLCSFFIIISILSLSYLTTICSNHVNDNKQLLTKVVFSSNGVLNAKWLQSICKIKTKTELVNINILNIKNILEKHTQVKSATVERQFPNTLIIKICEHKPIAKIFTKKHKPRLVSKEGAIFIPQNYTTAKINKLITITDLKKSFLSKNKILSFNIIFLLIKTLYLTAPEIYYVTKSISLKNFDKDNKMPWSQIKLITNNNIELVFSSYNIKNQLSKLQTILLQISHNQRKNLSSINLSFKNPVIKIKSSY